MPPDDPDPDSVRAQLQQIRQAYQKESQQTQSQVESQLDTIRQASPDPDSVRAQLQQIRQAVRQPEDDGQEQGQPDTSGSDGSRRQIGGAYPGASPGATQARGQEADPPDRGGPGNFFTMLATEAERGFRMYQQQSAADLGIDAAEQTETAGGDIQRQSAGMPGASAAAEAQELTEEEARKAQKRAARQVAQAEKELQDVEQTQAMERLNKAIESGGGGEFWSAIWENPSAAVGLAVQSSAMQPDAIIGSGLASLGNPALTAVTGAASANAVESRAAITKEMRKRGIDLSNSEEVLKALQDPDLRAAARERGKARGTTIAGVDLATNLLTAGLGRTGLRPLAKGVLGFGAQTTGEATGERLAQKAAGEDTNTADVYAEAVGGAPLSAIETVGTIGEGVTQANQDAQRIREFVQQEQERQTVTPENPQPSPLAKMETSDLEQAREEAREQGRKQDVEFINEELQRREREADDPDGRGTDSEGPGQPDTSGSGEGSNAEGRGAGPDDSDASPGGAAGRAEETMRQGGSSPAPGEAGPSTASTESARQLIDEVRQAVAEEEAGGTAETRTRTDRQTPESDRSSPDKLNTENLPTDPRPDIGQDDAQPAGLEQLKDEAERTETRPEKQVSEEVERVESELEKAENERDQAEQELKDTLADIESETIEQLKEDVDDPNAVELIERVLAERAETQVPDEFRQPGQQDPTEAQTPSMFGDQNGQVRKAVMRAAKKFAQRQKGVEAKKDELRRVKPQEAEKKRQQREAQQTIDDEADEQEGDAGATEPDEDDGPDAGDAPAPESEDQPDGTEQQPEPGKEEDGGVQPGEGPRGLSPGETDVTVEEPVPASREGATESSEEGEAVEEGAEASEEEEVVDGEGADATEAAAPSGTVTVRTGLPEGGTTETQAELTDDEVRADRLTNEDEAVALAEEAAKRDVPLTTGSEASLATAEQMKALDEQGYDVYRNPDAQRENGQWTAPEGEPAFRAEAPQIDPDQPTLETESGYTVGRALRPVTRRTTRSERPDGQLTDRPLEDLQAELDEAIDNGDEQFADQVRQAIETIRRKGRQTTYQHAAGEIVVQNPNGRLIDARSGAYQEAIAEYFAEHENELREGTVEPSREDKLGVEAALRSDSPQQVVDSYRLARRQEKETSNLGDLANPQEEAIESYNRYDTDSFRAVAGEAAVMGNGPLRLNWLSSNGKALDAAAQEITSQTGIETTPQDIVDYLQQNATRSSETDTSRLADHFEQLTGVRLTDDLAQQIREAQTEGDMPDPDDVPDVDAPFQTISEEGPSSAAQLVRAIILRITGDMNLPIGRVTVAATPADLPDGVDAFYEQASRSAGDGQIRPAFYLDGQVYIVASAIEGAAGAMGLDLELMARMSLFHEAVAHQGMRGLLGEDFETMMDAIVSAVGMRRIMNARTATGERLVDANADLLEMEDGELTAESRRLLADEFLARIAEGMALVNTEKDTIWGQIKQTFASALGLKLTDADIELLLQASHDHLASIQEGNPVEGTRFDRRMGDRNPARWMVLGPGARDFDEAQKETQVSMFDDGSGRDISVNGVFRGPYDDMLRFEISDSDAAFNPDGPIVKMARAIEERERQRTIALSTDPDVTDEEMEQAQREMQKAQATVEDMQARLRGRVPLERVLNHDTLFGQYPELREVPFEVVPMGGSRRGAYRPEQNVIALSEDLVLDALETAVNKQTSDLDMAGPGPATVEEAASKMMRTLVHEMQHWVQMREGYARGASPQEMTNLARRELTDARNTYTRMRNKERGTTAIEVFRYAWDYSFQELSEMDKTDAQADLAEATDMDIGEAALAIEVAREYDWDEMALNDEILELKDQLVNKGLNPFGDDERRILESKGAEGEQDWIRDRAQTHYWNTAGEIEARIAAERRDLSMQRRQEEPFYEGVTDDVLFPPEEVVVRYSTYNEAPDQLELFRGRDTEEEHDLVSVHNLSEASVRRVDDNFDGHIPVPSVAVVKYHHGFDRFGKISLLGQPDLVDPENGVPVYDSDVWSPTSPNAQRRSVESDALELQDQARPYAERADEKSRLSSFMYAVMENDDDQAAQLALRTDNWAKMMYLGEVHGRDVDVPTQKETVQFGTIARQEELQEELEAIREDFDPRDAKELLRPESEFFDRELHDRIYEAVAQAGRRASKSKLGKVVDGVVDSMVGDILGDGTLNTIALRDLFKSVRRVQEQNEEVDSSTLKSRLNEAIEEEAGVDEWNDAMSDWAARKVDQVFGDEFIEDPASGRELPITLENIVDVMTQQNVKVGEDAFLTSLKNARARGANQFRTLDDLQADRDRIVTEEQMEQIKDDLKADWERLREQIEPALSDNLRRMRAIEMPTKALAEMLQRRLTQQQALRALRNHGYDVDQLSDQQVQAFVEFGKRLTESPTQYFEAKPQRAVPLEEFEAAVVPHTTDEDVVEILQERVGEVRTYEDADMADRKEQFAQVATEQNIRFQTISEDQMAHRFQTVNDGEKATMTANQNMLGMHNLSPDAVEWTIDEMDGYIPAPSIAIRKIEENHGYRVKVKEEAREGGEARVGDFMTDTAEEAADQFLAQNDFDRSEVTVEAKTEPETYGAFGKISLVATPDVFDPADEPVFAADVYSPRTPHLKTGASSTAQQTVENAVEKIVEPALDWAKANEREKIHRSAAVTLDVMWDEFSENFSKLQVEKLDTALGRLVRLELDTDVDATQLLIDAIQKTRKQTDDAVGQAFNRPNLTSQIIQATQEADPAHHTYAAHKQFYQQFETELMMQNPDTGRFEEVTPQRVADVMMRSGIRARETDFGMGPTRAMGTRQFESIEEIQEHRDKLVTDFHGAGTPQELEDRVDDLVSDLNQATDDRLTDSDARRLIKEMYERNRTLEGLTQEKVFEIIHQGVPEDLKAGRVAADRNIDEQVDRKRERARDAATELIDSRDAFFEYEFDGEAIDADILDWTTAMLLRELYTQNQLRDPNASRTEDDLRAHLEDRYLSNVSIPPGKQKPTGPGIEMSDVETPEQEVALRIRDAIGLTAASNFLLQPKDGKAQELLTAFDAEAVDLLNLKREKRQVAGDVGKYQAAMEAAETALDVAREIRNADSGYFEAKPARAVPIEEFRAIVVPSNLGDTLMEKIQQLDLEVRTYSDPDERGEIQASFEDARFQTTGQFAANDADVPFERRFDPSGATFGAGAAVGGAAGFAAGGPLGGLAGGVAGAAAGPAVANPESLQEYWDWIRSHMRRLFTNRGDLPIDVFEADIQRQGWLKATMQRVKWTMEDFHKALEDEYGARLTEADVRQINEALHNGRRRSDRTSEQGKLFDDDPEIEAATPANDLWFSKIPLTPEAARTQKTYIEDLPDRVQEVAEEMRQMVDDLSHAGIKTGLFSGPLEVTVEENLGTYLTRAYRIHDEPGYGKRLRKYAREQAGEQDGKPTDIEMDPGDVPDDVPAEAWNRAVGWYRQNHPHMSEAQIMGKLLELLRPESDNSNFAQSGEMGQVPGEIYAGRKDIPEELRTLLGQYNDPATNFQKSAAKMATGLANQSFLNEVKRKGLGRFLFEEPQVLEGVEYTEQLGEDVGEAMQPLSGLYTTPEIAEAFRQYNDSPDMPAWQEWLMKAAVALKFGKTVGSLRTQARNYYGNILFGLSQGHLFSMKTIGGAAAGAAAGTAAVGPVGAVAGAGIGTVAGLTTTEPKQEAWSFALRSMTGNFDTEEARAEWQRMLELGLVGDSVRAGELRSLVEDLDVDIENPDLGMGEFMNLIVEKGVGTAEKAYQLGDEVWKVFAWKIEKERYRRAKPEWDRRKLEERAANIVRNTYPTYSLVPKVVKELRRLPTNAPFVSFFSEVFRTTFHSMRIMKRDLSDPATRAIGMQRAIGMLMAQGAMKVLFEVSKYLTGYDDEDDEYLRRLLPSWSQFSNIFHLPSEDGKAAYMDLGYLNPYKGYSEAVIAIMQGDDIDPERAAFNALLRVLDPFISEEILTQKVREAITNMSSETGQPIVNPALQEVDPGEFYAKRVAHVLKGFEPGTMRSGRRIYQAATEKGLGSELDLEQEVMSVFTGQRIKTIDMAESLKWEAIGLEDRYRNASRLFSDALTRQGQVTKGDLHSAYSDMVQAKERIIEHAHEDVKAATNFGLSPREAYGVLRSQRIGKKRAMMMIAGQYVPTMRKRVLRSRIEGAVQEGRDDDAQTLLKRREDAIEVMNEMIRTYKERHPNLEDRFESARKMLNGQQ